MKYLVDTNILLWFSQKNPALPADIRDKMLDPATIVVISIASLWEIGIKYSLKKLSLHKPLNDFFADIQNTDFIEILPITSAHIIYLTELPMHHRDPFDRLIFSQAMAEKIQFLYTDDIFNSYVSDI